LHSCCSWLLKFQRFLQHYRAETTGSNVRTEVPNDFPGYYAAAVIARRAPESRLYYPAGDAGVLLGSVPTDTFWGQIARAVGFDKTLHFNCPPFAALLLEPLGLERWQVSLLTWRVALSAMMLASIYLTLLLAGTDHLFLCLVLNATAVFSFFPFTETLFQGQIDPIIVLLWVAGIYLFRAEHPVWSALCFAVGTMVKVSPVVVVGLFLLRRQ
jgi:hypothetical protein